MNERTAWLLAGLAAAIAGYVWYLSGSDDSLDNEGVSSELDALAGGIVNTIRGIRNNNPTNMVDSGIKWDGMTGVDANGFCVFGKMADGITAAKKNLRSYWRLHGINTVDGIVRRWSATDQDAYVSQVASYLGVDPQESLDMEDDSVRTNLVRGMSRQEDGAAGELLVDLQIQSLVGNV